MLSVTVMAEPVRATVGKVVLPPSVTVEAIRPKSTRAETTLVEEG